MKKLLVFIFIFVILAILFKNDYSEEILIPNNSIRIRVIANSDSKSDQKIKKNVKESIKAQLSDMLKDAKSIDDVRNILNENLGDVEFNVKQTLEKNYINSNDFKVNFGKNFFPEKKYKGVTYNEGYYESIVISLGKAEGNNWWCVLFPPLCLMEDEESDIKDVEYKFFIKEIINKYF